MQLGNASALLRFHLFFSNSVTLFLHYDILLLFEMIIENMQLCMPQLRFIKTSTFQ